MSALAIRDGTGQGHLACVDANNRLRTTAISEAESKDHAKDGDAFSFAIHDLPVPANTPLIGWWIQFDDPTRKFYVNTFFVSWNGGTTSNTKVIDGRLLTGVTAPTANHTVKAMGNLNWTSAKQAQTTSYVWNGTGAGMTVASQGLIVSALKYSPGVTYVPINGTMILGKGNNLATLLTAAEAGVYSCVMSGWFE
jgi:hypothetical protein